jgi:predicted dehydrogenase/aryl-alcohol dehydrogenase-like predicted oxidoreductase
MTQNNPPSSSAPLRWGIISTGGIAHAFARNLRESLTGKLVAVASRSQPSADKFAEEFGIEARYASYESLLADPNVQAVYIATPHPLHAVWAMRAAEAKKHVLVEKPIGMNFAEAMAMTEAARANGVFLMEAFMYRCHPQIAKLVELIQNKAIGEVRMIQATFSFKGPAPTADSRLVRGDLGGGGILDVGCYAASLARLIAGAAVGKPFSDAFETKAVGHLESTGIDGYSTAVAKFPGEILAQLTCGVQLGLENMARVIGTDGIISLDSPWIPGKDTNITVQRTGKPVETIPIHCDRSIYAIEADVVAEYLAAGEAPQMSWADSRGNMRLLDDWRRSIGLEYEAEKFENLRTPVSGRPLKIETPSKMKYGKIAGIELSVSRLGIGAMFQFQHTREAMATYDDYFERGGNLFDTSHWYGTADKVLGKWAQSRGVRDQICILGKGAHTPWCNPRDMVRQINESIDALKTDRLDLYMLHRDNLDVPVGEFVDALNELKKLGRIHAFGGSNWTMERLDAANSYAKEKGLTGFEAMSNNFSLADALDVPWKGCVASTNAAWRQWLTDRQMPIIPWSSQARGFFTDRSGPDKRDDETLARCFYSDENFERKRRAAELADKLHVDPVAIALAYVLYQPFPTFPLIGALQISETVSSFRALDVELSLQQVKWLNLEE